MEIQKMAVLIVWGYKKSGESYVKQTIICEDWDKANELGMKFDDTTTIDDGFANEEQLKNFLNIYKKGD